MQRWAWIEHKGKKILLNDYSCLKSEDLVHQIEDNIRSYQAQNPKDVLLLVDVSNCSATIEIVAALKKIAKIIQPMMRKSAVIGVTNIQKIFLNAVNNFSSLGIKPFDTREQALEWLSE